MEDEKIVIRNFVLQEDALFFQTILKKVGIDSEIDSSKSQIDGVISGNEFRALFELCVLENDSAKANEAIKSYFEQEIEIRELDADYYLFSFTDDELKNMLIVPHEWNEFDVILAKKILKDRNVTVDFNRVEKEKNNILNQISEVESTNMVWIYLGYVTAFLGGLLGLFIGSFYYYSKKILPSGKKVYTYNDEIRKYAKQIFIISLIVFPITFFVRIIFLANYF